MTYTVGVTHSTNLINMTGQVTMYINKNLGQDSPAQVVAPYQVTASVLMGTLIDGTFAGATFTSSLINGYILGYGNLVGSWTEAMIDGAYISASYPFVPLYPDTVFVNFIGKYVNGQAFGAISSLSSSYGVLDYGIFDGVFTSGPIIGNQIHAPFSGSILSSSYFYTSSVNFTSSSLSPVNTSQPFTAVIQNIPSSIKAGDLVRINVFARQQFPIKNFNRQTQFTQIFNPTISSIVFILFHKG